MVRIERDAQGKTRVAKGDKSGFGGQYAPDAELLKRYAEQTRKLLEYNKDKSTDALPLEEYNDAVKAKELLEEFYESYNKEQEEVSRNHRDDVVESEGFTYFADFCSDVPTSRGMLVANSKDGQPRGWQLRIGKPGNSGKTGTGFFSTREEALAAIDVVNESRKNNSYVQEQLSQYDASKEKHESVFLPSAPHGPWGMELRFFEPEPNVSNPKENGYHAGWCIVAVSDEFNNGSPIFIEPQGYKTREEASQARKEIETKMEAFAGKERAVYVEGKGNVIYNNLNTEQYEQITHTFGFTPRPWMATDLIQDYYPKSNYPGD